MKITNLNNNLKIALLILSFMSLLLISHHNVLLHYSIITAGIIVSVIFYKKEYNKEIYYGIFKNIRGPFGLLLLERYGKDFICQDVNLGFEEIIFLKDQKVIGKKLSELLTSNSYPLLKYSREVISQKKTMQLEEFYSSRLNAWYNIFIFSLQNERVAMVISPLPKSKKLKEHHYKLQEETISLLREERHDILNELALASTCLQMGRYANVKNCIDFIAANLSDKYNYLSLPDDAWTNVLESKKFEAQQTNIDIDVQLYAASPTVINEKRLLPKLTANLLDNAFYAVSDVKKPWVGIKWFKKNNKRYLVISNNGPRISVSKMAEIFQECSTDSLEGGYGLKICHKIANELGGELTVESNELITQFCLILPNSSFVKGVS